MKITLLLLTLQHIIANKCDWYQPIGNNNTLLMQFLNFDLGSFLKLMLKKIQNVIYEFLVECIYRSFIHANRIQ